IKAKKIAEDANNTKNHFISNISHELRTPVAVIASSSQLLRKLLDSDNGEYKESFHNNLNIITQNSNRLLRLINNIIDIAKIDSGFTDLNLQNVDVINLIEDSVMSVIPYAQSKNLEVIFDTNVEELIMSVDSQKIERIILNLLSNAIKFSYEGGQIFTDIIIENNILTFIIVDEGIGISEENLSKIFDKFIQIDNSFTRSNEGSGIGLSLVKSFVKLHGGTIDVESKIGQGTSFTIKLPITIIDDSNDDAEIPSTNSHTPIELSDIFK
ncbi:MAG: sensor histidine kinase, partial [Peptostreptococcaceae bacterium]